MNDNSQPLLFEEGKTVKLTEHLSIASISIDKLKIHPKNNKILPKLNDNEKKRLKKRIKQYGFNEPIEITKNKVILDGNYRIEILREYKSELNIDRVPYKVIDIDEGDEVKYIVEKNSDRRQLSPLVLSYLRGKRYNEIKSKQGGTGANQFNKNKQSDQNDHSAKSSEKVADKFGVSSPTIRRDAEFSNNIDLICSYYHIDEPFDLLIHDTDKDTPNLTKELTKTIGKSLKEFETLIEGKENWISKLFNIDQKATEIISNFMTGKDNVFKSTKRLLTRLNEIYPNLSENFKTFSYDVTSDKIRDNTYNFKEHLFSELKKDVSINNLNEIYNEIIKLKSNTYKKAQSEQEYYRKAENKKQLEEMKKIAEIDKIKSCFKNMDCNEYIKTLKNDSIDLFLIDPPYGMDFDSGWSKKDKIQNDGINDTIKLLDETFKNVVTKLKDNALIYVFGNNKYICHIQPIFEKYFKMKDLLIWDREIIGMGDLNSFGASYDVIYFGYNKKFRKLHGERPRNVLRFKRTDPSKLDHPTIKPNALIEFLIEKSTIQGENVLDCFAGSGTTLVTAKKLKRGYFGCEINEEYYNIALKNIIEV